MKYDSSILNGFKVMTYVKSLVQSSNSDTDASAMT